MFSLPTYAIVLFVYKLEGDNMATAIITDSTSYINPQLIEKYDIKIASLYVVFGQDDIKETEISNEDFYQRMEKEGIPISSQPALGELVDMMKAELDKGNDIIGVFLSSEFSGTFNSVSLIKAELEEQYPNRRIEIIDSRSNSMQLGFAALTGARLAKENKGYDEIIQAINDNIQRSRFLFIPDNLTYLEKGGRIGKAGALVGNVLKITPILTVENGTTEIFKKVRTKKKAIETMINKMMSDHELATVKEIAIHHINCEDEALDLKAKLEDLIDVEIIISSIGPVIGLHVGPGAVGLVYYTADIIG